MLKMSHNVVIPTIYGPQIINRHAREFDSGAKYGTPCDNKSIESYAAMIACTGPNPLIVDVGGCFGDFTLGFARLLARLAPRIITFEPQAWLFHCIAGTIALNDLSNVQVFNAAIGAKDGYASVPVLDYEREGRFGSLSMLESPSTDPFTDVNQPVDITAYRKVDMVAIDTLEIAPTAMKIDCEGMEIDALIGAEATIGRARPLLFVEHIKSNPEELARWLKNRNYLLVFNDADLVCYPSEKREFFPKVTYE
jgi:FkbM family methyltransferase